MGNAILDAYGNVVYGDDAGKSAKLVFVARPRRVKKSKRSTTNVLPKNTHGKNNGDNDVNMAGSKAKSDFDVGMTFIEVNGRAYVKTVTPDADAAMAGVQPRDAVQFAFVHTDVKITSRSTSSDQDEKAALFALECERKGRRTPFIEFCDMFPFDITLSPWGSDEDGSKSADFMNGIEDDNSVDDAVIDNKQSSSSLDARNQLSDMKRLVKEEGTEGNKSGLPKIVPRDANGDPFLYPVTIVFRRTRQRKRLVGGGMPHLFIPNFRLDDECDRAALLVRKLAPTADMDPQPDAWDEIVHDGTEWLFPSGSIMPPSESGRIWENDSEATLTARQRSALTRSGGNGKQSVTAGQGAVTRVDSAEFDNVKTGEDTIPQDSWEANATEKISIIRQRMMEEAKLKKKRNLERGGSGKSIVREDVEAATIRGMVSDKNLRGPFTISAFP